MINLLKKINRTPSSDKLLKDLEGRKNVTVGFLNSYSYCVLRRTGLMDKLDYIYCDGMLMALLTSCLLFKKVERVSFDMTSLAKKLFILCEKKGLSLYFIGSEQTTVSKFCLNLKNTYPRLKIVGYSSGYFDLLREKVLIDDIVNKKADIVICGMGAGKQEDFILKVKNASQNLIACFTCGGFIHQASERLYYYPKNIDLFQLRWLYRLVHEPHTRRRFFKYYPLFLLYFIVDIFNIKRPIA